MRLFQSTLPRRERLYLVSVVKLIVYFNPRSHEGSDKILHILHNIISIFQSTLPRRERPRLRRMPLVMYNFNPRSHEGSDDQDLRQNNYSKISIHAPTKGATNVNSLTLILIMISIHAPTKGATVPSALRQNPQYYFNPRSHEGSDIECCFVDDKDDVFQSTLPRRERRNVPFGTAFFAIFQSTLPRRERR